MNVKPRTSRLTPGGFTLVELIVVVALISILAGVIVPRLTPRRAAKARSESDNVFALVEAATRRAALSTQEVVLAFDSQARVLRVLTTDPADAALREDPLIAPVELGVLTVEDAWQGPFRLGSGSWEATIDPLDATPIQIHLLDADTDSRWTLLESGGQVSRANGTIGAHDGYVDLDRTGQELSPW